MAQDLKPDICVVGGGPGGVAAALAGVAAGLAVVLVEKAAIGGSDFVQGSVPLHALISAAAVKEALRRGPPMGVSGTPVNVNLTEVRRHIAAVTAAIAAGVSPERLAAIGIRVVAAPAHFASRDIIAAGEFTIRARRIVLAVGAVSAPPDLPGRAGVDVLAPAEAFDIGGKANRIVLGATRGGFELAQAYARLGIDVTVVDPDPALADDDPELSAIVVDRLRAEGVRVRTDVRIESIARHRGGIRITVIDPIDGEIAVDGSHLLIAAGRAPAIADLGLDAAGIAHDNDGITVDAGLRTTNHRVYAIGDAIAGPARAARAVHEGREVVRSILWRKRLRYDAAAVPRVTHTDPALATVGMTEADARRAERNVRVLRFPFVENELAEIERLPEGVIKVIATARGHILGAAIVGRNAGELIAPWSLAIANRLPLEAIGCLPMAYPSRSDVSRRVVEAMRRTSLTAPFPRRIMAALTKRGWT